MIQKKISVYDICEVKKNEIAFICSKEGKIYGKYYYLIFYDYEKDKEIYSKKLNNKGKLFIINENNLIFAEKNKLMLMNLKDYNFVNEIGTVSGLESFLALNHKFFLCFFPGNFINVIYHYEIEKDNLIEKGSEWEYKYKYAIKYGDKLISCSDNEIYLLFHND